MKEITTIVVPVDLEEHSEKIVEFAAQMADRLSANLSLVHVVEPFRAMGDMDLGGTTLEQYHRSRLKNAADYLLKLSSTCPHCTNAKVVDGDVVDEIVAYAEREGAGMIVIGTHGTKGLEKLLLGSVAERVVKRAHCPTLVMNPFKYST